MSLVGSASWSRGNCARQRLPSGFEIISERLGHGAAGLARAVIGVSPRYQIGRFFMYIIKRKEEQQQRPKPPRIVPRLPCQGTAACAHETTSRIPRFRAQIRCLTILKDGPQVAARSRCAILLGLWMSRTASMLRDPKIAFIVLHTSFAADSELTAE
jgi:hypothetical protein